MWKCWSFLGSRYIKFRNSEKATKNYKKSPTLFSRILSNIKNKYVGGFFKVCGFLTISELYLILTQTARLCVWRDQKYFCLLFLYPPFKKFGPCLIQRNWLPWNFFCTNLQIAGVAFATDFDKNTNKKGKKAGLKTFSSFNGEKKMCKSQSLKLLKCIGSPIAFSYAYNRK